MSPGYFDALDVELLDGRTLGDHDRLDAPGVAVVNEAFAREGSGRAVGRRLRSGTPPFMYPAFKHAIEERSFESTLELEKLYRDVLHDPVTARECFRQMRDGGAPCR